MATNDAESGFIITLVRHGETQANRDGIIQGHMDTLLNEEGKSQVKQVAQRLKRECFNKIYSSDLKRAMQTAEGICLANRRGQGSKICAEPLLRERDFGSAQGKLVSQLRDIRKRDAPIEGAETVQRVHERAATFFDRLLADVQDMRGASGGDGSSGEPGVHVLLVSHGGWIRSFVRHLNTTFSCDLPSHSTKHNPNKHRCPNTGVTVFRVACRDGHVTSVTASVLYDKSHLKP